MCRFLMLIVGALSVHQAITAPAVGDCPKGDVIFVIDRSGSIGADWPLQVEALKAIVGDFPVGSDDYQFGAVAFSSGASDEFDLDTYSSADAVRSALDNITYTGGSTNIAAGFQQARLMFGKPGNRPLVGDIIILFTDGASNLDVHRTDLEVEWLKLDDVLVITVGISEAHTAADLERYASNSNWYFPTPSYAELTNILPDLSNSVCQAAETPSAACQYCNDFDNDNYGYLKHEVCYKFYLCRKQASGRVDLFATMQCAPGTMFDSASAKEGKPCVLIEAPDTCDRVVDYVPPLADYSCPYVADPAGEGEFGLLDGNIFTKIGQCGGGYWDANACTCLGMLTDCRCKLMVDFVDNVQDHSCTRGWISNNNPKVILVGDGIFGGGGHFSGLTETSQNGAHLLTWSLNGALNPCEHGGQDKLTVATWMKYSAGRGIKGLVSYCGEDGASFFLAFNADTGIVSGGIDTYDTVGHHPQIVSSSSSLVKNDWYYVSMVYDSANIRLYVTRRSYFAACSAGSTASHCQPEETKPLTGCVESRNCGLQIGASGKSWRDDEFFIGNMDDVQVLYGAEYLACRA